MAQGPAGLRERGRNWGYTDLKAAGEYPGCPTHLQPSQDSISVCLFPTFLLPCFLSGCPSGDMSFWAPEHFTLGTVPSLPSPLFI